VWACTQIINIYMYLRYRGSGRILLVYGKWHCWVSAISTAARVPRLVAYGQRYFCNCSIPNHIVTDEQYERKGLRCRLWHNYNMYNIIYIYRFKIRTVLLRGFAAKNWKQIPLYRYILFYIIVINTMSPKHYSIIYYNCSLICVYYTRAHDIMRIS